MKALVIYYSRSGKTKDVAERIARAASADIEEIVEVEKHPGYARSAIAAILKRKPALKPFGRSLDDYDLVFVGTPVWRMNAVPAIQSFLATQAWRSKQVALFCTMGGMGDRKTFRTMRELMPGARVPGEIAFDTAGLKNPEEIEARVNVWVAEVLAEAGTS